jgi:curved DNA-binding protein CbpA
MGFFALGRLVMGNKKTLYEVLNVLPSASFEQIQAEYKGITHKLESGASGLSAQDTATQLKLVNMAFQVLRDNMSRAAYDAKLTQQPSLALVPKEVDTEALTMKMQAAVMKADAAALMAQAAIVNANAISMHYAASPQGLGAQASTSFFKTFRFGFTVLGAVVAIGMVVMVVSAKRGSGAAMDVRAQEQVMLQEYYQTHGVRPGSKAEMDVMEAQRRKDEAEKRGDETAKRNAEKLAEKKERDEQRFKDETARLSSRVTENLQRDEERAQRLVREEEYKNQREQEKIQYKQARDEQAHQERLREYRRSLGVNF